MCVIWKICKWKSFHQILILLWVAVHLFSSCCDGKWLPIRLSVLFSVSAAFSPCKMLRFVTERRQLGKVDTRKPYPHISMHVEQHSWYYVTLGFLRWMLEPNTSLSKVYEVVVFIHERYLSYTKFGNICKCYWAVFYPTLVERMMALAVMTLSKLSNEFQCLFLYIFSKLLLNTCQREYFSHFCCFSAVRVSFGKHNKFSGDLH